MQRWRNPAKVLVGGILVTVFCWALAYPSLPMAPEGPGALALRIVLLVVSALGCAAFLALIAE